MPEPHHRLNLQRVVVALLPALFVGACVAAGGPQRGDDPAAVADSAAPIDSAVCVAPGGWVDAGGRPVAAADVLRRGAAAPVVALGESHDSAEHHRWQAQTLAGLYALNPHLAVGMEMFPRRLQPVLDRWTAGELDEAAFLRQAEWDKVWGYDAAHYLPILHFARMHRLPLIALNVERSLVARTAREGWEAVPADVREGVGDPAPVSAAYRERLTATAAGHGGHQRQSADSERFIAAQSVWDRAMAEAAATAHRKDGRTVVAIIGRGHAQYRDGMIRQLAALDLPGALAWLPWERGQDCNAPGGAVADALFGIAVPPAPAASRPRLGVELRAGDGGVTAATVAAGSVAARAGLKPGDVIVKAAGAPVRDVADLIAVVRGLPPGVWLPLQVRRGGALTTLTAKFPVAAD